MRVVRPCLCIVVIVKPRLSINEMSSKDVDRAAGAMMDSSTASRASEQNSPATPLRLAAGPDRLPPLAMVAETCLLA